jgi:hypothetical protein
VCTIKDSTQKVFNCTFCEKSTSLSIPTDCTRIEVVCEGVVHHEYVHETAQMGSEPTCIGNRIHWSGKDVLWCTQCTLLHCGVPDCTSCHRKNQIHFCDRCGVEGSNHRARNCPNPK